MSVGKDTGRSMGRDMETDTERSMGKDMEKDTGRSMGKDMGKSMEKRQTEQLKIFDRELFSYTGKLAWFLVGIFSLMALGCMLIPVQAYDGGLWNNLWFGCCIGSAWISYGVLLPYTNTADALTPQSKSSRTYLKLRYLPVGKKQYVRVRMGYLFRYLWKLGLVGMILQCGVAFLEFRRFGVANILYAAGELLVLPMLLGWLNLEAECRGVARR